MRRAVILVFVLAAATAAHDVITTPITFSREISRLLYSRCVDCHRPGGPAFSLMTYEEARPWAKAIKEEVLERRMPPWSAVKGFGAFQDDRGLTQEQIELIAEWVEGGAPEGDAKLLPKAAPAAPPASTASFHASAVRSGFVAASSMTIAGIRAKGAAEGASLMVTAERPDGTVEPLLWLYDFHSRFARDYWYASPPRLPARTKITIVPEGVVELLTR